MSNTITYSINLLVDGKKQLTSVSSTLTVMDDKAKETKKSISKLTDQLIHYNQSMEAMKNSIGTAVSKLNEWNASLQKAQSEFARTAQFTGLAGSELNKYSAGAKALADTFDSDFNEVVLSSNSLMKAFGRTSRKFRPEDRRRAEEDKKLRHSLGYYK